MIRKEYSREEIVALCQSNPEAVADLVMALLPLVELTGKVKVME